MCALKTAFPLLACLLLLLPFGFCTWNQTIDASVVDQKGSPVAGAAIRITYQKSNGITGGDGLAEGRTGEGGHYIATISNSVPGELESREIEVEAGASSWHSGAKTLEADGTGGTLAVQFVAPFTLGKVTVIVLQKGGAAASGASVYVSGSETRKTADSFGKATFYLPMDSGVSGFVSYGSEGEYFTSAGATAGTDGGMEILVRLPQAGGAVAPGTPAEGSTVLTVYFIGTDSLPLGGEKVAFSHGGSTMSAYTDALGAASVVLETGGEVRALVRKNDYDYSFTFNVSADGKPKSETAALAPLLMIDYFESAADGAGCWRVSAKVSDPRTNRPITVKMAQMKNGTQPADLQVALDEGGKYTARVCGASDTLVRAVASNSYDTVEKTISVSHAGGESPQQAPTPTANATGAPALPQPIRPTSPAEGLEVVLVLAAILVTVLVAAAAIIGKSSPEAPGGMAKYFTHAYGIVLGSTLRPILEYLRSLRRRREPPVQPPAFQPPPPQGPMMPPA